MPSQIFSVSLSLNELIIASIITFHVTNGKSKYLLFSRNFPYPFLSESGDGLSFGGIGYGNGIQKNNNYK